MRMPATDVDAIIGTKLREHRKRRGVTLAAVAESIGVTFQQVHKYERGQHRISAGQLYAIAQVLETPAGEFFP